MNKPMRFALIMDMALGWRTNYMNWQRNFPTNMQIEPIWINMSSNRPLRVDRIPGLPRNVKRRLRSYVMLHEGLRQGPFDATYFQNSMALTAVPRYIQSRPCFFYIDSTVKQLYDFGEFYGWYPSRFKALEQIKHQQRAASFQNARGIFSMSQWAGNSAVADYGATPENVHVFPPGVDMQQWQPGAPSQKSSKEHCDLLFVGGDFQRKGGDLLLKWAKNTTITHWNLHLVTPHPIPNNDPRIHVYNDLTSNDPRLVNLYHQADAFVLPTRADCSSWAGIEALASGLPLVIGDTGGTGEIVRPGETGFLIGQGDEAGLAQSLEALIADAGLRRQMGAAARADAECRYDAAKLVRQAVQVMRDEV